MKRITLSVLAFALCLSAASAAEIKHRDFTLALDPENAFLPKSLTWKDVELLDPIMTLNFTYTDFMYRTKYYREENKHFWGSKPDKRFVVDVAMKSTEPDKATQGQYTSWQVDYETSYAKVSRAVALHNAAATVKISYDLEFTHDKVIHEPMYFGALLRLAPAFSVKAVPDIDAKPLRLLQAKGYKRIDLALTPLNPGPVLVAAPDKGAHMLITYAWTGDLPSPMVTRQWRVDKGQKLNLSATLTLAPDAKALLPTMEKAAAAMQPTQHAFLMVANANILIKNGKVPEGEKMLLRAAAADKTYSLPYSRLAQVRRNPKSASGLSPAECFTYASYRQPYNYGWSLSGVSFPDDKRLTERERRLAIFNQLISVENCQFYAEYYLWVARHFEKIKMYAQACAMTRQALWALNRLPRPEAYKQKHRDRITKQLKALEEKLIHEPTAELPPMIEIDISKRKKPGEAK